MATIKLTDTTWLDQEAAKVEGVLRQALGGKDGKAGKDAQSLKALLNYAGLDYDTADLVAIRDKLVTDGVIEVVQD